MAAVTTMHQTYETNHQPHHHHATAHHQTTYSSPAPSRYQSSHHSFQTQQSNLRASAVLSERFVEHEYKVPKKVMREEVIEKVIVVPERVMTEHVVEEVQTVRQKIVEIAKPVIKETYVEVPEVVYVEKVVEVPERVNRDVIKHVPRYEYVERVVEVPRVLKQERIVEIPEIEYREVVQEKIVEVPEIREQIITREVPVPQYVDKMIPEYVPVNVPYDVVRHVPVPVVANTQFNYELSQPKPKYSTTELNVYVPRFIEVPVPAEFMDAQSVAQANLYIEQVAHLAAQPAASLCEIENLAGTIKNSGITKVMDRGDYQQALKEAWKQGHISVTGAERSKAQQSPGTGGDAGSRNGKSKRKSSRRQ